ncbi:TEA domain-containing protein [Caenorhabditis elegans]|uniref:TEA domain-containing protein n=1 Tax=Caenorhabditis elegans TaxID=6239 RepID=A0A2C9C3C4_CAEEL|nr:TEA domain-containing protein [Caenorhabditis elegans]SOF58758.1 TEA domain-containing protein [Caenorhabditis elegans]|eukprot:NP_001343766.1 Transcription enhancer factor-like protein egl-44 [Caenorhabditis elegans]
MSSIFPNLLPFQLFMSEDVAVTAQTILNGTPPHNHFRKEWLAGAAGTTTPTTTSGGQMMTLSPPAGDGPGSAGSMAPESTSSLSDLSGDAEGVWSIDIDQAFQEALAIYPPCGRRKIIISDEGKMYGRNELIARYIKLRCGKTRTRKQVSSHIQVLARKKLRDEQAKKKGDIPSLLQQASPPGGVKSPSAVVFPPVSAAVAAITEISPQSSYSSIVPKVETDQISQQLFKSLPLWSFQQTPGLPIGMDLSQLVFQQSSPDKTVSPVKSEVVEETKPIASSQLTLHSFSAYVKCNKTSLRTELVKIENTLEKDDIDISVFYEKYPKLLRELFEKSEKKDVFFLAKCWANINVSDDVQNCQYAVDSFYSSREKFQLKVSTMACSFGNQAVEKIEQYFPIEFDGSYSFILNNSPMCDYMVKFIAELKKLNVIETMNNVLENFTVLQIVTNSETDELLMVLCFVFEVSQEPEPSCSVYRLIDGGGDSDE